MLRNIAFLFLGNKWKKLFFVLNSYVLITEKVITLLIIIIKKNLSIQNLCLNRQIINIAHPKMKSLTKNKQLELRDEVKFTLSISI